MKRRDFLKIVTISPIVPGALIAAKENELKQPAWIEESFHRQDVCRPTPAPEDINFSLNHLDFTRKGKWNQIVFCTPENQPTIMSLWLNGKRIDQCRK